MLGVARLAENKRVHKVLEAMALLKDRYPHLSAGMGRRGFLPGCAPSLERRVIELGLSRKGALPRRRQPRRAIPIAAAGALFVSASAYEGFGLSTIEAMSAATVVVVTAVGVHPDVVQDGVSGFLIDPDAAGLAAQMERALSRCRERTLAAIGEAARAATRRFSWSRIAPQYEQLYREVLGAETSSAA